ncbi:hypothetical protein PAECIP111893_03626 [Paenibacillus plantiphilus]|uniref:Uncharacterized protein n=1 Tax=Paenibacillus plantiphilus TaxID=2905650 RepID=A0ABN8GPU4_9BACL|nr:hypothetical protein PAECIP111893_03626 [Paenibacillus plantiphilus]
MEGFRFVSNTNEMRGFRCLLKSITNGKREWKTLGRKDKQEITAAVKVRTTDMHKLFLNYIEGDLTNASYNRVYDCLTRLRFF